MAQTVAAQNQSDALVGVLGGVCLNDLVADPKEHASLDVNGWFEGEYRDVRYGTRPIFEQTSLGAYDFRGVFAYKTDFGAIRLIACVGVNRDVSVTIRTGASSTTTQNLYAGEVAFLVLDPTYFSSGALACLSPVPSALGNACIAVVTSGWATVTAARVASDAVPRSYRGLYAQFYPQGDSLLVFGLADGALSIDYAALRQQVIRGTFAGGGADYNLPYSDYVLQPGAATMVYSYFDDVFPQVNAFRVEAETFYVPQVANYVTVSAPISDVQESIPENRLSGARTEVLWDSRIAVWSERENPNNVAALYNMFVAPGNKRIVAIVECGNNIAFLFDEGALLIDAATKGQNGYVRLSRGCAAPWSAVEVNNSVVYLSHHGVVMANGEGEQLVSSPFLDAMFRNEMRSTLPSTLGETGARLGYPWRIDHARMGLARAYHDAPRGWYVCFLTTQGSVVENDLVLMWDYRRNRFFFHKQQETLLDGTQMVKQAYVTGLTPTPLQYFITPFLHCTGVSTALDDAGKTQAYICNELGIHQAWSGDVDYTRTKATIGYGYEYPSDKVAVSIESVRVSPAIALSDSQLKTFANIRYTLWENVYEDNGTVAVYSEGERGSTQLRTGADLARPEPFIETQEVTSALLARADRDRGYWSSIFTWGDSYVWQRPDYVWIASRLDTNNVRWARLTFYDQRSSTVAPVLKLVNVGVMVVPAASKDFA